MNHALFISVYHIDTAVQAGSCKKYKMKHGFSHCPATLNPWANGTELLFRQDMIIQNTYVEIQGGQDSSLFPITSP